MKKVFVKIVCVVLAIALCVGVLTACKPKPATVNYFGQFGCYGNYLIQNAVKSITAPEARQLIDKYGANAVADGSASTVLTTEANSAFAVEESAPTPDAVVDSLITKYSGFWVTTKYYDANDELGLEGTLKEKRDEYVGGLFKSVLEENNLETFAQLVARNIIAYDGLIEWMEEQNSAFAASEAAKLAPFLNIYTYHTDDEGNLVIQVHSFRELNSKDLGGISANFRQDTEIVYDTEGKMVLWQTSLGISNASPTGTMRQGYILSLDLDWIEKE